MPARAVCDHPPPSAAHRGRGVSKADDIFWKEFGVILLLLLGFSVGMFIIARVIGAAAMDRIQTSAELVAMRIEPVGRVRVGDPTQQSAAEGIPVAMASEAVPESTVAAADAKPGEAVYGGLCHACHAAGLAGAPKPDDTAAWTERAAKGLDAMLVIAIQGRGGMPPRGGNPALTDEELRQAIEYMLEQAGVPAS